MAYPTTAELVAASSVPELTSKTAPQQDALRDIAIANIERYTGQKFIPEVGLTRKLDGSGGRELWLDRRLETLTAIVVTGTSIDLTDVDVSEKRDRLYFRPFNTSYAVMAMREEAYDSRTFRAGAGEVLVTGTWGWSVVPAPVVQAIRIEMETQARVDDSRLSGTVAAHRRLGLKDIAQGNLRAMIGDPALISPEATNLLSPTYVWFAGAGAVY